MATVLRRLKTKPVFVRLLPRQSGLWLVLTLSLAVLSLACFDNAIGVLGPTQCMFLRNLAKTVTLIGDTGWSLLALAFLCLQAIAALRQSEARQKRVLILSVLLLALYMFLTLALSGIFANFLKQMIGRARPEIFTANGVLNFLPFAGSAKFQSFPSGHATSVGALFMMIALLQPKSRMVCAICALWIAMTRVLLGQHYPSDVLTGLALGAWFAWFMALIFAHYRLVFRLDQQQIPVLRGALAKVHRRPVRVEAVDEPLAGREWQAA